MQEGLVGYGGAAPSGRGQGCRRELLPFRVLIGDRTLL